MKPTTKQIRAIEFLEQQLSFWKKSNDIGSPTHIGDIREFSQFLSDDFTEYEIQGIDILTHELYLSILEIE
jgi:hypothetical protein